MTAKSTTILAITTMFVILTSCGEKAKKTIEAAKDSTSEKMMPKAPVYDTSDPASILASVEYAQGGWGDLWNKKDVQYSYDYRYPDGKADVSTERYIFATEASFGDYKQHDINAMPGAKGEVMQYFDGEKTVVMLDEKKVEDPQAIGGSEFLRRANYFWFVMPYKLNDKGTIAKYMGQEEYKGTTYDKVEVSYDASITGKEQNDTYILYVNPTTKMIDRFYFSLPAMGMNEPLIVADYEYEDIEGQKVATKRSIYMPSPDGYSEEPNLVQTLTDVKFNNGFAEEGIMTMTK